jgi:hypothetical protein
MIVNVEKWKFGSKDAYKKKKETGKSRANQRVTCPCSPATRFVASNRQLKVSVDRELELVLELVLVLVLAASLEPVIGSVVSAGI